MGVISTFSVFMPRAAATAAASVQRSRLLVA